LEQTGTSGRSSLESLMAGVDEVKAMIGRVSVIAEEQTDMSRHIASSMLGMSSASTETAATVTEIAQTVDNMLNLTETVSELMGQFTIEQRIISGREYRAKLR
jgi:methyl-accepting chemotaxis protein